MLGLTATPKRADGLSKVFEWYLGAIVYQISRRPKDDTVLVEALRYTSADDAYTEVPTDWQGKPIRARMINNIANFTPRTQEIVDWVMPYMERDSSRKLLILSDRREHLIQFEALFRSRHISSLGYYIGGMKQKDLDASAKQRILLGTFAMASEGMNIPTLNAVLLATPKSSIEQSVGRILRLKPEERTVQPIILDILDTAFNECLGQWSRRKKFYKECGYSIRWAGETVALPNRGFQVHLDGDGALRTVSLIAVGRRSAHEGWSEFSRRMRRTTRGLRVKASPWGAVCAALGAGLILLSAWSIGAAIRSSVVETGAVVTPSLVAARMTCMARMARMD